MIEMGKRTFSLLNELGRNFFVLFGVDSLFFYHKRGSNNRFSSVPFHHYSLK